MDLLVKTVNFWQNRQLFALISIHPRLTVSSYYLQLLQSTKCLLHQASTARATVFSNKWVDMVSQQVPVYLWPLNETCSV